MKNKNVRIEELKKRTERCCCKYCGGGLELRRILYGDLDNARIEIFCQNCDRIEYGVEKEIYHIAKYYVEELEYNAYPDLDYTERTRQMSISQVCDIVSWGCKNLSLLDSCGFKYPVFIDETIDGSVLKLSGNQLDLSIKNEVIL